MLEKLAQIEENYEELNNQLSSPDIMSDISAYTKLMKQHRSLGEIVKKYRELKKTQEELDGAKEIVADRFNKRYARGGAGSATATAEETA